MIISELELERRLNSENNLVNRLHVVPKATRVNSARVPRPMRVVAGTMARIEKPSDVAKELGMSINQVREARNLPEVKSNVERVQDLALTLLMDSLGLLKVENLAGEKPKDIASISANMSRIYQNVQPKQTVDNRTQVLVYAPQQRNLEDYDVTEVRSAGD